MPTVVIKVIRVDGIPIRALYLLLENLITVAAIMAVLKIRVITDPQIMAVTRHRTVVHLSKRPSILMLMATLSLKKSMIV